MNGELLSNSFNDRHRKVIMKQREQAERVINAGARSALCRRRRRTFESVKYLIVVV